MVCSCSGRDLQKVTGGLQEGRPVGMDPVTGLQEDKVRGARGPRVVEELMGLKDSSLTRAGGETLKVTWLYS